VDTGVRPKPTCILVLQGGGAMGAYHIGAYQALREAAFEPDWVCGISMGAINGAIIAGNAPEQRLDRLDDFWETVSRPSLLPDFGNTRMRRWEHRFSYAMALTLGQPGFFSPRPIDPYFAAPGIAATSFYETDALHETLGRVLDFDRLNSGATRLSVGATDVETGRLIFFDTHRMAGGLGAGACDRQRLPAARLSGHGDRRAILLGWRLRIELAAGSGAGRHAASLSARRQRTTPGPAIVLC
jgi:NTE family protein